MQDRVWISLALACLLCRTFCESKHGCASKEIEIDDRKLLLRLNWDNGTGPEIFTAISAEDCGRNCCEKNESCNVAQFHSSEKTNNCLHAYCYPLSKCLKDDSIEDTEATMVYQLVEVDRGTGQRSSNRATKQPKVLRSIKSRKGVDGAETTTYESTMGKQSDAPTVEKPNKPETTTTEARATTQQLAFHGDATVSSSTVMDATVESTLTEDSTPRTEIPDLDADKMKHIVPRKGASDGHPWAFYSTPAALLQPVDQQPRPPIPTQQIALPSSEENTTEIGSRFHTEASTDDNPPNSITSSASRPSEDHENLLNVQNSNKTTDPTSELSSNPTKAKQNESNAKLPKNFIPLVNSKASSGVPPVKLVVSGSIDFLYDRTTAVAARNMDDLHFQQSIYLIVFLIIGFLVLLLVIGMVLKHVYGVWERRHYQRMDFLIDGLYNSRANI